MMSDQPLGELQKGLELLQHDATAAVVGESNDPFSKMQHKGAPKFDMKHPIKHGIQYMSLESPETRAKQPDHFSGQPKRPVNSYVGCLWKWRDPTSIQRDVIKFA